MIENKWARKYLRALFETQGKGAEDIGTFVSASGFKELDDPLLEISFLRQSASSAKCQRLSMAALALCGEDTPVSEVSELIETVEVCNSKLAMLADELPRLKEAACRDPKNGEKLTHLGFALLAVDERDAALSAFTQALEWPATLCIHCHRDCLVNIGWHHYGYRWITAMLQEAGWQVGKDRVRRIWRREGLKVPQKQRPRRRLWLNDGSCVRLRPERVNHVWSYDFVSGRTHDGRAIRMETALGAGLQAACPRGL